jgi:hypothetical protein
MPERVFVSGANLKCPGVTELGDLADLLRGRKPSPLTPVQVGSAEIMLGEEVGVDRSSPFYPTRSNEKVMRSEVIAATIGVCELLQQLEPDDVAKSEIPLYVAAGTSLERKIGDLDWFARAFAAVVDCSSHSERNKRLSQVTPPLLALRTLTNATSSFIAERTQVAGNNTTFGSTSISGFYALKEGYEAVRGGRCSMAVVGGASRGGVASYFMYRNFFDDSADWRESLSSTFLLLESESSVERRAVRPLCELTLLQAGGSPPCLSRSDPGVPFARFAAHAAGAPLAIFSGAFCRSEFVRQRAAVSTSWAEWASLFEVLGNGGTANVFLNILAGLALSDGRGSVDCLDRDPYCRESLVRATVCEP